MTRMPLGMPATAALIDLWSSSSNWWDEINESRNWQDGIFFTLCSFYAFVSAIALFQLIRIELRVPEYGWTTQKVFHIMNFIVNGVRAVVFGFHTQVFKMHPKVCIWVLLEVPGLLFFSTYTLLVLFWAEIYHQARSLPTDKLRVVYVSVNAGVYFIQGCIWIYLWMDDNNMVQFVGKIFIAVVSFMAALGFLLYGGRLFLMLRRFPIESKGRRKKLHEVCIWVLLEVPGLLFFSTYTLLVLFWAEIYHQARSLPTDKLRVVYVSVNAGVYFIQGCIWIYLWMDDNNMVQFVGKIFIAVVSFIVALGFLLYGGRLTSLTLKSQTPPLFWVLFIIIISDDFKLFLMLRRFPIESKGRRKKLHEVGSVTGICFTCFLIRCFVDVASAFDSEASLDVLDHPVLNLIFYMLVEILPSALVLYILRKLPSKRVSARYHSIS